MSTEYITTGPAGGTHTREWLSASFFYLIFKKMQDSENIIKNDLKRIVKNKLNIDIGGDRARDWSRFDSDSLLDEILEDNANKNHVFF